MRFCVKVVVMFCTLLIGWALYGASATWTGIYTGDFPSEMTEGTMESELRGRVSGSDGVGASIIGMFYIHEESATMRLKAYDYSETAAPVTTRWLLAVYGDIFGADTLSSFKDVELCSCPNCGVGGDVIEEPTNFYLAFVAENWNDYLAKVENPHVWYGWANCAVKSDGSLDVLSSGINLDGGPVRIGGDLFTPRTVELPIDAYRHFCFWIAEAMSNVK